MTTSPVSRTQLIAAGCAAGGILVSAIASITMAFNTPVARPRVVAVTAASVAAPPPAPSHLGLTDLYVATQDGRVLRASPATSTSPPAPPVATSNLTAPAPAPHP